MTARDAVLENHTLVVRDGRILDLLPNAHAAGRYAATVHFDRSAHLVLPGLVDAHTRICPLPGRSAGRADLGGEARLRIAQMLSGGTTCFCGVGYHPEESARAASELGMRAVIGMPIAASASPWAASPAEYLTRALSFHDEFRGHPSIATAFALEAAAAIPDATFGRIATLADELDAGILMTLHASRAEVDESLGRYGLRPIERMHALGLLTPALTAAQMVHVGAADIALAVRSGIAITLCPESSLRAGEGLPPLSSWAAAGLRQSLGSGTAGPAISPNLWNELRLMALFATPPTGKAPADGSASDFDAWHALAMATRGGAAALGLETQIGTLERGKWADLCCIDPRGPVMHWPAPASPRESLTQWVLNAGRDVVSDVWVAGRHLLNGGDFARLDWPRLADRLRTPARESITGENHADIR